MIDRNAFNTLVNRRELLRVLAASAALADPLVALGQQAGTLRRIGWLSPSVWAAPTTQQGAALVRMLLRQAGYEEGRNLAIELRFADGKADRLPALANELVRLNVEVILAYSNEAIAAARHATRSIPIVMLFATEPVEAGFIASLARPGGNLTGTAAASSEFLGKMFEALKELAPLAKRIALLGDATFAAAAGAAYAAAGARAATAFGMVLTAFTPSSDDMMAVLERIADSGSDAICVAPDAINFASFTDIAAFALKHKLATLGVAPQFVRAGGLLSCGPDVAELLARTVSFVDRILRGARPADLPVEMPSRFPLLVNQTTARAIGLTIPPTILARADEVVQ